MAPAKMRGLTGAHFVAACQICNMFRGEQVFNTLEEDRQHVRQRRYDLGYHASEEGYDG